MTCILSTFSYYYYYYYLLTYLLTYLFTYLLFPWNRVPLEKLTSFQLVKKFLAFYGTQRLITAFTRSHHLSHEPDRSSRYPHIPLPEGPSQYYPPICGWVSQVVYFPQVSPPKPSVHLSSPPHTLHALPISFFSI